MKTGRIWVKALVNSGLKDDPEVVKLSSQKLQWNTQQIMMRAWPLVVLSMKSSFLFPWSGNECSFPPDHSPDKRFLQLTESPTPVNVELHKGIQQKQTLWHSALNNLSKYILINSWGLLLDFCSTSDNIGEKSCGLRIYFLTICFLYSLTTQLGPNDLFCLIINESVPWLLWASRH